MQVNVRWCCAAGESSDRSAECDSDRWCRSARPKVRPTRPRRRKWTARKRWITAGIKIAGLARIPRLVPKTWLSERSKLSKRCQTRLTVSTKRPSVREGPRRKLLGARKALESSTQKAAIAHESRKLAEEAIAVAEFAFASPREPPDKISLGLDTLENAKESPSDLTRESWKERRCHAA